MGAGGSTGQSFGFPSPCGVMEFEPEEEKLKSTEQQHFRPLAG